MRFVLCDDDQLFTSVIEAMLTDLGHEVVGVGTTSAESVALVRTARPDVVIVEPALGFTMDFDIVEAAVSAAATTIVFSHTADDAILSQYPVRPRVVDKPDLGELQRTISALELDTPRETPTRDRRERPTRPAAGRPPTNLGDAQAFYESLNEAGAGDVLVSIEVPADPAALPAAAERVLAMMRDTDRLLASPTTIRVYLPAGDDVGATSFRSRLETSTALPEGATVRVVVLGSDESPADAFDRLKSAPPEAH